MHDENVLSDVMYFHKIKSDYIIYVTEKGNTFYKTTTT